MKQIIINQLQEYEGSVQRCFVNVRLVFMNISLIFMNIKMISFPYVHEYHFHEYNNYGGSLTRLIVELAQPHSLII